MPVESKLLSLWALDFKQEEFHDQGKSNVILKARQGSSALRIPESPSFGYGASGDCYWDSIPHTLPLLPYKLLTLR